jgi:hypothetical protein
MDFHIRGSRSVDNVTCGRADTVMLGDRSPNVGGGRTVSEVHPDRNYWRASRQNLLTCIQTEITGVHPDRTY